MSVENSSKENILILESVKLLLKTSKKEDLSDRIKLDLKVKQIVQEMIKKHNFDKKRFLEIVAKVKKEAERRLVDAKEFSKGMKDRVLLTEEEEKIIANIAEKLNDKYRKGMYKNSDLKLMLMDIVMDIENSLAEAKIQADDFKKKFILTSILLFWSEQNKGVYIDKSLQLEDKRARDVVIYGNTDLKSIQNQIDYLNVLLQELVEIMKKDPSVQFSLFKQLFGINIKIADFGDLPEAVLKFLKELILGSGK